MREACSLPEGAAPKALANRRPRSEKGKHRARRVGIGQLCGERMAVHRLLRREEQTLHQIIVAEMLRHDLDPREAVPMQRFNLRVVRGDFERGDLEDVERRRRGAV